MEGRPRRIVHYLTGQGENPYDEWFCKLRDSSLKGRILSRLLRVESGNFGDFKALGGGVYEMRIDAGPGYRIYFGLDGVEFVVIFGGVRNATQDADIRTAKGRWADYHA